MELPRLDQASHLSGKRVLVRVDFNVPVQNGFVTNDFRIKAALPTITFLKKAGAKIILISHREGREGHDFLPVSEALRKYVEHVYHSTTDFAVIADHASKMKRGDVVLLTNLRYWGGEEMCTEQFGLDLSKLADVYVNEAFASSHRRHASIVLLPKLLPSYIGFRFQEEIENLSKIFTPEQPFLFILGGAKFETKEPLIRKFLPKTSILFVCGALANDFLKVKGFETGRSFISKDISRITEDIYNDPKIVLPSDVMVETVEKTLVVKKVTEILKEDRVVDAGPETIQILKGYVDKAKYILWNGPLGIYEEGQVKQTEELAIVIAESRATSTVGGGDTTASIQRFSLEDSFDFLSTAGGAMLDFLVNETLPGIEAFQK